MPTSEKYPNHTIGQHIVPFQLIFDGHDSVEKVLGEIKKKVGSWPNSESVFIVNENKKLIGEVDFKSLLTASSDEKLYKLMKKNFEILTDHSHQNTAIQIAIKKGVESIAVTDQEGLFLGIIDAGQILKIMHEEHIERLMHFSGILDSESLIEGYHAKIFNVAKSRFPWLFLGLIGGIFSTFIVESFASTLKTELSLAFFIPIIVYMNDAVGTQTQTIFVRLSALEKINLLKTLIFELKISLLVATPIAVGIFIFTAIWLGSTIGEIVGLSMFLGMLSSALIATLIPWTLERLGKDPAIGSGPFTTIIQDLLSIIIYFKVASILL